MLKKICFVLVMLFAFGATAQEVTDHLYHYKANVVSIYDGDTIRSDLQLGLGIVKKNEPLRLYGINAPEVRGPEKIAGYASRDYLREILKNHEVIIETLKDKKGKYGRYIAIIWVKGKGQWCELDTWCNVNDQLVKAGHAIYVEY